MIDQWSRLSRGYFIKSKNPSEVVDGIWMHWISVGYGSPGCIHSDVGGEFSNEELVEMADRLGCKVSATAGYAPHQNGLNERNHAVNDDCMNKIKEDNPNMKDELVLAHALFAKNSLQMTYGYSSLQLVLGQNPNIPNIFDATPPMLEEELPTGNVLRNHLNALHSARVAFLKSEANCKIKRALKHNVRKFSNNLEIGDSVYFNRKDQKCRGPGKIIGKDGAKNFLVSRGGLTYRVEGNVIVKVGEEFLPSDVTSATKNSTCDVITQNEMVEEIESSSCSAPVVEDVVSPDNSVHSTDNGQNDVEVLQRGNNMESNVAGNNNGKQRIILKKNDKIKFREDADGEWAEGTVLQRAGKALGKYDGYYNVQLNNDSKDIKVINMHNLPEWNKIDAFSTMQDEETAFLVMVPKEKLKDKEVVDARMKQLEEWKNFDVYDEVETADKNEYKVAG